MGRQPEPDSNTKRKLVRLQNHANNKPIDEKSHIASSTQYYFVTWHEARTPASKNRYFLATYADHYLHCQAQRTRRLL